MNLHIPVSAGPDPSYSSPPLLTGDGDARPERGVPISFTSSEAAFEPPTGFVPSDGNDRPLSRTEQIAARSAVRLGALATATLATLGVLMAALVFLFGREGSATPGGAGASVGQAFLLALCGGASAWAAGMALTRVRSDELLRTRVGWGAIAGACALYGAGWLACAWTARGGAPASSNPALLAEWFRIAQQPLLWLGLFCLAWRGRALGLMRLLTDTIIVVLSALVLLYSLVLEGRLLAASPQVGALAKFTAIYYPMCDSAHLFCVLILLSSARHFPALARAARWLFVGIVCLIASDTVTASLSLSGVHPAWLAVLQGWGILFLGVAAVASVLSLQAFKAKLRTDSEEIIEAAPRDGKPDVKSAALEEALAHWHRSAMQWLPYLATLAVSCILLGKEFWGKDIFGKDAKSVQHLLPVLGLLLAIAARQMLTLWDNVHLTERLRASNLDLEQNVNDRTRHLATLHSITSTLNGSLDRRTILRVALEKIIVATGATAGGIWLKEARRDVYDGAAPLHQWVLMHWQGGADPAMPSLLRDMSIAQANEDEIDKGDHFLLSPGTREAVQAGIAPPRERLILVPIRWHGTLLGVLGLMREAGEFGYEDRALVESVALEAGAALQNARMYSEAAHRADRDSVTNLLNHRAVQDEMTKTLARCKRSGGVFSIVMMDLNNFKFFNDTYGHPVGDEVLRAVARSLRESCRGSDILGRYGGDEFIVVLPDTDAQGTFDVCARIKAALDAKHFEPVPGTRLPIGTAFGWAAYPQDGETIMDLLQAADANLYNHKRGGASYLSQSQKALQEGRDELRKLKNRAHGGSFGVLDALVTAIDNKDHYTRAHSEEVTYLSLLVARELDYSREQLEAVRISGLLHDVGKIAVPDSILRHPGKLGRDEWDIMQQHPVFGALIVKDVPQLERVLEGIKYHHEKWDGSGYPEQRVGENIPELGRLLAMGDCYSALTTDRPYRKGWKPEAALEEIERCSGSHFDPRLCAIFLEVMRRELSEGADTSDYGSRISEEFGEEQDAEAATT